MDWLATFHTKIDCYRRRISLVATDGKREVFEGKRGDEAIVPLIRTVDQVSGQLCSMTIAITEEEEASEGL
ncbi:hypothetical protein Dimus_028775, partial [Dionaea muscipula]